MGKVHPQKRRPATACAGWLSLSGCAARAHRWGAMHGAGWMPPRPAGRPARPGAHFPGRATGLAMVRWRAEKRTRVQCVKNAGKLKEKNTIRRGKDRKCTAWMGVEAYNGHMFKFAATPRCLDSSRFEWPLKQRVPAARPKMKIWGEKSALGWGRFIFAPRCHRNRIGLPTPVKVSQSARPVASARAEPVLRSGLIFPLLVVTKLALRIRLD